MRRPLRLEHPLDQLLHLRARSSIRLVSSCRPRAGHEHPARVVDPDLLDRRVVEEAAAAAPKPDTRATSSPTTASTSATGATTPVRLRSSWARTTRLGEPAYDERVALRVDALAAYGLAHPLVERLDQVGVRVCGDDRHADPSRVRDPCQKPTAAAVCSGRGRRESVDDPRRNVRQRASDHSPASTRPRSSPWAAKSKANEDRSDALLRLTLGGGSMSAFCQK